MKNDLNPQKVRVVATKEVYYTFKHWPTKEIDGVQFISVVKNQPSQLQTQISHWMRKDTLEYLK